MTHYDNCDTLLEEIKDLKYFDVHTLVSVLHKDIIRQSLL